MLRALCHVKCFALKPILPSNFNYGAPAKPQEVGPQTSHPLVSNRIRIPQNHLAQVHNFLDADKDKLLAKHHTTCEVKEKVFIRVS